MLLIGLGSSDTHKVLTESLAPIGGVYYMTDINQTWQPYLDAGEKNEDEFIKIMIKLDKDTCKKEGNFKEYDFNLPNLGFTIELKGDYKSDDTGNFAFEYECFGKKSGLAFTTAKYFVMTDARKFYLFNTADLKSFLRDNWVCVRTVIGGDNNASKMALIRKEHITGRRFCFVMDRFLPELNLINYFFKQYE